MSSGSRCKKNGLCKGKKRDSYKKPYRVSAMRGFENIGLFGILFYNCINVKELEIGQTYTPEGEKSKMGEDTRAPVTYIGVSYLKKSLHSYIALFSMTYGFFFLTKGLTKPFFSYALFYGLDVF
jgi:hypothetical protein